MKGNCLECQTEFRGRADKKFCSDPCRNAWNNRKNRINNPGIRMVHRALRTNYRILRTWERRCPEAGLQRDNLLAMGFRFEYLTAQTSFRGQVLAWVYDRAYYRDTGSRYKTVTGKELQMACRDLFPVMGAEFEGSDNNVFPTDLTNEQAVLHDG